MKWYERLFIRVLKMGRIPKSIAIIMDGNRRFAEKRNQPKHLGHESGLNKLEQAMAWCLELGIKDLTVFALSVDNLKRSKIEVDTLMDLAKKSFLKLCEKGGFINQNGIQVNILGDLSFLPEDVRDAMIKA